MLYKNQKFLPFKNRLFYLFPSSAFLISIQLFEQETAELESSIPALQERQSNIFFGWLIWLRCCAMLLINIAVPKGRKTEIKAHAEAQGESVNGFIGRAIDETMERDTGQG